MLEKILNNMRLKASRNSGRMRRGVSKGFMKAAKIISKMMKALNIGKVIGLSLGAVGLSMGFFSCAYLASDEDDGETGAYIDNNNIMSHSVKGSDGSSGYGVDEYSPANAASKAFYELVSEQSMWQEYTDENGEVILIKMDDERAVSDYFKRDKDFYIHPDLLFCMNKYVFGDTYVYPETFIKPIAYDPESFETKPLSDENGNIIVESRVLDDMGNDTGDKKLSVSDYGLGTVCRYKSITKSTYMHGKYYQKDVVDINGEIVQRECDEEYNIPIESESLDVLDKVLTFSGSMTYTYTPTTIKQSDVVEGSSDDESENVTKILYDTVYVDTYVADFTRATGVPPKYSNNLNWLEEYCLTHPYEIRKDAEGNPVKTTKECKLYKYRDSTSGIYVDSYNSDTVDVSSTSNEYLYDYLKHFSAYAPQDTRSYETFRKFSSKASSDSMYKSCARSGSKEGNVNRNGDRIAYIESLVPDAQQVMKESGVLASLTLAQAILEGGWFGTSELASTYNNYFGIKAGSSWTGETVLMWTKEQDGNGISHDEQAYFRVYDSPLGSFRDHANILWNPRYKNILGNTDYVDVANNVKDGGYATDAEYAQKLINLIEDYGLYEYDTEVWDGTKPDYIQDYSGAVSVSEDKTNKATYKMNDKDAEAFYNFYHKFDNAFDGTHTVSLRYKSLSESQIDDMLRLTNSYVNGTTIREESLYYSARLWEKDYIINLLEDSNKMFAGTLSGISLADAAEIAEYDFIWMVAIDDSQEEYYSGKHVTSRFGPRPLASSPYHAGTDIKCNTGVPILAVADGVVELSYSSSSAGEYIVINHGTDTSGRAVRTEYMHNSQRLVNVGDEVKRGQIIAYAGSTGQSTGPHCHFGLTINGTRIDSLIPYRSKSVIEALNISGNVITITPTGRFPESASNYE